MSSIDAWKSSFSPASPPVARIFALPSLKSERFIPVSPDASPISTVPFSGIPLIPASTSKSNFCRSAPISFTVITPYAEVKRLSRRLKRSSGISGIGLSVSAKAGDAARLSDAEGSASGSFKVCTVAISVSMSMLIPPSEISASRTLPVNSAPKFTRPDRYPAARICLPSLSASSKLLSL